jgi:two-component system, LuxR family, response regulator FixJ
VNLDKILNRLKTLTPREYEVLKQVVSGRLNKEIASELGITIRTVKEHRGRVMEKMEADSLAELVTMIVTVRLHETG